MAERAGERFVGFSAMTTVLGLGTLNEKLTLKRPFFASQPRTHASAPFSSGLALSEWTFTVCPMRIPAGGESRAPTDGELRAAGVTGECARRAGTSAGT